MPYDRAELHHAKVTMYYEFEPKGENMILPFNSTTLKRYLEEDGKVIELESTLKIKRITKTNGKTVYEF